MSRLYVIREQGTGDTVDVYDGTREEASRHARTFYPDRDWYVEAASAWTEYLTVGAWDKVQCYSC